MVLKCESPSLVLALQIREPIGSDTIGEVVAEVAEQHV
jgi:hypothetical protein